MNKKTMRAVMISLIFLAGVISIIFYSLNRQQAPLPKPVLINTINQPTVGNSKAKLHIVVFEDLKCVNCMRFNTLLYPKIKKKYIDNGKAKYTVITI